MKPVAPDQPVSKKRLRMGHTVAALVPVDMKLVGSPLFACAAVCIFPGDANKPAIFDLFGTPMIPAEVNGQQVALQTGARLPLQYMGATKRALGWCWPEEFDDDGIEPIKVH